MSKREIAIKAKHMCLSSLSLMGSSKTKPKPLNCASGAAGNWSHVQNGSEHGSCFDHFQGSVQAEQRFAPRCLFVLVVSAHQGQHQVWFGDPNRLCSVGQGGNMGLSLPETWGSSVQQGGGDDPHLPS